MSDTDDTNVLLSIPPNFYLVKSSGSEDSLLDSSRTVVHKPSSSTAQVLGNLVNQVYSLENRLDNLELSTVSDTVSNRSNRSKLRYLDCEESIHSYYDQKFYTFPRRRRRKLNSKLSKLETSLTSFDSLSTCGRKVPPLQFKVADNKPVRNQVDDSPSMDGDLSSIVSTPNKKNDKLLLHEIDEFLMKVDTYDSPESKYKADDAQLSSDNVIKATGDYLSQKLEEKDNSDDVRLPSGRIVSASVLDKYIYLVKSAAASSQSDRQSSKLYNSESKRESPKHNTEVKKLENVEIKSPSVRRLTFHETNKDVQPTSTPKRSLQSNYLDTFRPSSNKIYDRATKVLEQYKARNTHNTHNSSIDTNCISKREDYIPKRENCPVTSRNYLDPQSNKLEIREGPRLSMMQNKYIDTIDSDLLSLTDLWGEKKDVNEKCESAKLEEERMKREHCEAMIQDLQKKLLEQQEKLAVAIKVDRNKDAAITKLKEAWLRITSSLDKAEHRHKNALENMMLEVDKFRCMAEHSQKKTHHYESELYKALDLAHDYQEKCKKLNEEKKELQDNFEKNLISKNEIIENKEKEIGILKENYDAVMRLNKQSGDCMKNIEDAIEKERQEHELTKNKLYEFTHKMNSIQEDSSVVQQENEILKEKVNEERGRCNILEKQLSDKQNQNCELYKRCESLETEVTSLNKQLESQRLELKNHYQRQLEEVVMSKLKEFQSQLDQAEKDLLDENRSKENDIIDTFNKQIGRIEEQHKLEINVLEEKHKEEIKLCRLQLVQASEKNNILESKLLTYRRRRGQLANELHAVMESQWRQALNILTNGHGSTVNSTRHDTVFTPEVQESHKIPPLTVPTFNKPLTVSKVQTDNSINFESLSDLELQSYVKMMLTKPASFNSSNNDIDKEKQMNEEPTSDRPDKEKKEKKRSLSIGKPPWKS